MLSLSNAAKCMLQRERRGAQTALHKMIQGSSRKRYLSTHLGDDPNDRLIVIGSGVAGCSAALIAAERHKIPVTLLCAGSLPTDCNSYWAQGGIIYRNYDPVANDSAASLVADVQRAGAGLCDDGAVWKLALEGPDRVRQLLLDESKEGKYANVPFDRLANGSLSCCLEASHAAPRIIHLADHTGKAITEHITAAALNHPLITVVTDTIVTDLIMAETDDKQKICLGTHTIHKNTGQRQSLLSTRGTVLASGGLGGIYEHSTNPAGFNALGSSTAIATRAGAHTSDLEYVQFHPTALQIPNESCFLLTEALRGEGAILRDRQGRAFAKDFHPDGELAPRDIVARGVFNENQKVDEGNNVFLDITHRDATWLKGRFPSIDAHLMKRGFDITKHNLPITPAAHYTCGGVTTDLDGCTNVIGLFSAGEAARTGLHGGNRLASTSLLEGLVYGGAVGDYVGRPEQGGLLKESLRETMNTSRMAMEQINEWKGKSSSSNNSSVSKTSKQGATELLLELKRIMWDHVGVVRTPIGLTHAASKIAEIKEEAGHLFETNACSETVGIRDAALAGEAVTQAALANRVSAGAHCIVLEGPEADKVEAGVDSNDDGAEETEIGGFLRLR
jgi:L-aspartate oxidase